MNNVPHETRATPLPPGHEVAFGELVLAFTTDFELRWSDKGSGASADVSFYHPVPPSEGFHVLGSVGIRDYASPNGKVAAICVKAATGSWTKPPLREPKSYTLIWKDSGSGAGMDGSCWRPVPHDGYVALGEVFVKGYAAPALSDVMCVAKELVWEGRIGDEIWVDEGSGASADFGAWQIDASRPLLETPDGVFAVNSFVGRGGADGHTRPASAPVVWNLKLPLPTEEIEGPTAPDLQSRQRPPGQTHPVVDRVVTVPFLAIDDAEYDVAWKVANSPFYQVERVVDYRLVLYIDNTGSEPQTSSSAIETGVSREASQTFSIDTGITVTTEAGVEAGGFSAKTTVSLSLSLGFSTTTAVTQFRSETDECVLTAPAGAAAAVWTQSQEFLVRRGDATRSRVGAALAFDPTDTAFVYGQFPKRTGDARGVSLRRWRHRVP